MSKLLQVSAIFLSAVIVSSAWPTSASAPFRWEDVRAIDRVIPTDDAILHSYQANDVIMDKEAFPRPASYPRLHIGFEQPELPAGLTAFIAHFIDRIRARDASFANRFAAQDLFLGRDYGGLHELGSPARILLAALRLDGDRSPEMAEIGWRLLLARMNEGGMHLHAGRQAVYCTGARPIVEDPELVRSTIGDEDVEGWFYWYFVRGHHDVRERPAGDAAIIGSLENELVFSLPDRMPDGGREDELWSRVLMPGGHEGFLQPFAIQSRFSDSLCFARDSQGEWKIAGYVGGGD